MVPPAEMPPTDIESGLMFNFFAELRAFRLDVSYPYRFSI